MEGKKDQSRTAGLAFFNLLCWNVWVVSRTVDSANLCGGVLWTAESASRGGGLAECWQFLQNRVKSTAESDQVHLVSANRRWYLCQFRSRFPDRRGSNVSSGTGSGVSGVACHSRGVRNGMDAGAGPIGHGYSPAAGVSALCISEGYRDGLSAVRTDHKFCVAGGAAVWVRQFGPTRLVRYWRCCWQQAGYG